MALWLTPPRFWRVCRSMSQYRRSTGRGSWPMSRCARSRTQPAMPYGLRLSLHSPQPTSPSSVSTRTNVQGRQPPSAWSASTRAIFMSVLLLPTVPGSEPGRQASPEPIELEQADALAPARRRPRLRGVVPPGRQEQSHVREVRMRGDVLEGLQPVLHEPQRRAPPPRRGVVDDQRAQVVALVGPGLLALDPGQPDIPVLQDLAGELPFLRRDDHGALGLAHQAPQLLESAVRNVPREPVIPRGGDPLAPDVVQRALEHADQLLAAGPLRAHDLVAHTLPAPKDRGLGAPPDDGAEQHGHLPPIQDHRPERAERREPLLARCRLVRPHAEIGPAAGLQVFAASVAAHPVEVERQDVGDRHVPPWFSHARTT